MVKHREPQPGQLNMEDSPSIPVDQPDTSPSTTGTEYGHSDEEPDPWGDIGGGDRVALRRAREKEEIKEILHRFGGYAVELGVGFEVQRNGDRFGTAILHSVELLADLVSDDYEGDIDQFTSQTYGQQNDFKIYPGERATKVRTLEARRAINSLGYLANCIARIGPNVTAREVIHDLTRNHPSVLEENKGGEALIEAVTKDAKSLIGLLGPGGPQEIQNYMSKLRFKIYAASRMPMYSDFTGYRRMISPKKSDPRVHYADDAWRRFFEHSMPTSPEYEPIA